MRKRVSGSCTSGNKVRSLVTSVGPISNRDMSSLKASEILSSRLWLAGPRNEEKWRL
jgi:hypothetical protein